MVLCWFLVPFRLSLPRSWSHAFCSGAVPAVRQARGSASATPAVSGLWGVWKAHSPCGRSLICAPAAAYTVCVSGRAWVPVCCHDRVPAQRCPRSAEMQHRHAAVQPHAAGCNMSRLACPKQPQLSPPDAVLPSMGGAWVVKGLPDLPSALGKVATPFERRSPSGTAVFVYLPRDSRSCSFLRSERGCVWDQCRTLQACRCHAFAPLDVVNMYSTYTWVDFGGA